MLKDTTDMTSSYSNDGGSTWCCNSNPDANYTPTSDPAQIGTLIPGVERLVGGIYDAGGDPSVAFDSQGNVYYAGLGFNRTSRWLSGHPANAGPEPQRLPGG
jgi:hypothetical protein